MRQADPSKQPVVESQHAEGGNHEDREYAPRCYRDSSAMLRGLPERERRGELARRWRLIQLIDRRPSVRRR